MNVENLSEDQLLEIIKQTSEQNNNKLEDLYKKMVTQLSSAPTEEIDQSTYQLQQLNKET